MKGTGMPAQPWLADAFATAMIVTAAYCLTRLAIARRQRRPTDHQVDLVHVLMGVAMAGMLVPRLRVFWVGGWEIVFSVAAAWFGWRVISDGRAWTAADHRPGHHLKHVLPCAAMVYMLAAVTSAGRAGSGAGPVMSGTSGSAAHFPTLALVLALCLLGYVVWTADRMTSLAPVAALAARASHATDLAAGDAGLPRGVAGSGLPLAAEPGVASSGLQLAAEPGAPAPLAAGLRRGVPLSPRLAACCEIVMGVTMGYMLIMMR
jgi:Domain of unknown function (DUF5134)